MTADYNFAYLDEQTKRMIRRAVLKAVAVPGYQVPFGSREMPVARATSEIPPRPIAIASHAAHRRLSFSFIIDDNRLNLYVTEATILEHPCKRNHPGCSLIVIIHRLAQMDSLFCHSA